MNAAALLDNLNKRGVRLLDGATFRAMAGAGVITEAMKTEMATHKPALLELLRQREQQPERSASDNEEKLSDPPALSSTVPTPAALGTLHNLDDQKSLCCGSGFNIVGQQRICARCRLTWPDADLRALREYLHKKRGH